MKNKKYISITAKVISVTMIFFLAFGLFNEKVSAYSDISLEAALEQDSRNGMPVCSPYQDVPKGLSYNSPTPYWVDSSNPMSWTWTGPSNDKQASGYGKVTWDYGNGVYTYDWLKIQATKSDASYRYYDIYVATTASSNYKKVMGSDPLWKFENHIAVDGKEIKTVKPSYPNNIRPSTGGDVNKIPSGYWKFAINKGLSMGKSHKIERITYNTDTNTRSYLTATVTIPYVNYSISYNLNGGSDPGNPKTYNASTASFTLKNPTRTGYTFTGWTGSNGSTPQTSVTVSKGSSGNKSYTANWRANTYTNYITHWKYVGSGGNNGDGTMLNMGTTSFTGSYGSSVAIPSSHVKSYTGYYNTGSAGSGSFGGWKTFSIGSSFTQPAGSASFEYYYYPTTYSISYNLNGGSNPGNPTSYNILSNTFTLKNPTRSGYTFMGWSGTGISGKSKSVTISKGSTGNRSYTANWDAFPTISLKNFKVIEGDNFPVTNLMDGKGYITQGDSQFPDKLVEVTYPSTANDAEDGPLTSRLKVTKVVGPNGETLTNVDTSKIGNYTVHYSVTDNAGATVEASRIITVLPASIAEIQADDRYFYRGSDITSSILKSKIIAKDKYDGIITGIVEIPDLENINNNVAGEYEITYKVVNRSHKTTTKKVKVYIIDTITDLETPYQLRYISDDYLGTLPTNSKWNTNNDLHQFLIDSMKKTKKEEAIAVFDFSRNDIKKIKDEMKENGFSQQSNNDFLMENREAKVR